MNNKLAISRHICKSRLINKHTSPKPHPWRAKNKNNSSCFLTKCFSTELFNTRWRWSTFGSGKNDPVMSLLMSPSINNLKDDIVHFLWMLWLSLWVTLCCFHCVDFFKSLSFLSKIKTKSEINKYIDLRLAFDIYKRW